MDALLRWPDRVTAAALAATADLWGRGAPRRPALAPTPRETLFREGTARLYRFRRPGADPDGGAPVVLLVPSLINRWYVLDLREGASLTAHLLDAGFDVYALDWGVPGDEDRHLDWDAVLRRLSRMHRRVRRLAAGRPVGLLGYCMGATLAAIHLALEPESASAFVNLAGPIDFSDSGALGRAVDRRWFDPDAIADAGNVSPSQMESGFTMLRPTAALAKLWSMPDLVRSPERLEAFLALEHWARDNIPFPAAAYRTYIRELYQDNALVRGEHRALGQRVDLGRIRMPVLTVCASRDAICPPAAATALGRAVGSTDTEVLTAPGGHVGAVVGRRASAVLYPGISDWLAARLG